MSDEVERLRLALVDAGGERADALAVELFIANVRPHLKRWPPYVHHEPWFDPWTIAFWRQYPDRLFCGGLAFAEMRARFEEAPPLDAKAVGGDFIL